MGLSTRSLLRINEAAELVHVDKSVIKGAIERGKLRAVRIHRGVTVIRLKDLDSWNTGWRLLSQSEKVKAGLRTTKRKLGRPPVYVNVGLLIERRKQGLGYKALSEEFRIGVGTVFRMLNDPTRVDAPRLEQTIKEKKWLRMARVKLREVQRSLRALQARQ